MAIVGGLVFVLAGLVAYTGLWKGWIRVRRGYGSTIGFSWLWLGLSFTTAGVALLVDDYSRVASTILIGAAGVLFVIAAMAFFWLPAILLPRWYRVLRGDADAVRNGRR
ncbi:hypothetical protein [Microbacterium sp. Bi128]|uniref:hypothetical protein n=1 Tax=Microbacterium sp. Bi128 TaxID=2821115 RepID=UPI001D807ECF|nr:hypothetical protein [Microbacterium sp. Bi128]CAH0212890.1 hypothetical protein SRABI128_02015 [Microbacterium sp. Bi128]